MSSASDRRYQSRLFNFVHQQARRVSDQCDRAFRHLQVATTWGVQVLLYPIYLLFQSSELAGKQMQSSVQQSWPELQPNDTNSQPQTPPTADTPIQRVLLLVNDLSSEEAIANIPTTKTLPFFLSATLRFKFFTVATPSASSCNTVVRGIATQLSNRTLVLITAQNEILDIFTPQQQQKIQERIIGEVANYWHFVPPSSPPLVLFSDQALAFLDRTVAELESSRLAPVSEVAIALAHRSWELVELVKTRLTVSLSGKVQLDDTRYSAVDPDPAQTHTFRIQALIWAAIDYFFGNRGRSELGQTTPTDRTLKLPAGSKPRRKRLPHRGSASKLPKAQLPSRTQVVNADVDPWLTFSDLFGDPSEGEIEISRQSSSQGTQIESAPEWIETHATVMGYVKHPLEQLLKWLDRAVLWLEELVVRVLQWVQQLWQGK